MDLVAPPNDSQMKSASGRTKHWAHSPLPALLRPGQDRAQASGPDSDDELWALIEPLLPSWPERPPGPRPVADRLCLQGILFVLYNDIVWQLLPLELGFGSGQTCWRRLNRWQEAGTITNGRILTSDTAHQPTSTRSCTSSKCVEIVTGR